MTHAVTPEENLSAIRHLLERICETPAPTFEERQRGELIRDLMEEAGLEPAIDQVGNVTAALPGGQGPHVLIAAHLDTVFPAGTDVRVREEPGRLRAPGIGDNSASLAILMHYAMQAPLEDAPEDATARPRLTLAATVGEEGLGDLYGVKELLRHRAHEFDYMVALDGHLGTIVNAAVGSKRFELRFTAKGGHSWGDYPSPSAIHALGDVIHAFNTMPVPHDPRSSYNVGMVNGGTSVNAIAQEASLYLDLRSVDADALRELERTALNSARQMARKHGVTLDAILVGDRPTARVPNDALVRIARDALHSVGINPRCAASSTDANAAFAVGIPAISFGVYKGGDAHRHSEWLEPKSMLVGYQAFKRLLRNLAKLPPRAR
jgi:tripeptide aminopeptidase